MIENATDEPLEAFPFPFYPSYFLGMRRSLSQGWQVVLDTGVEKQDKL